MKRLQYLKGSIYTLFALILMAGCISSPTRTVLPEPTEAPRPLPTLSPTETHTPSPTLLTSTPTPEPTRTPEFTSTEQPPTQTPTAGPTMIAKERKLFVKELLKTNSGCILPCWWGIIPGETRWHQALEFLHTLGARIGTDRDESGAIFHATGGFDFQEDHIYNRFGFEEREGVIESVYISSEGYANQSGFQSLWWRYSPKNVITEYGPPTRVWIKSTSNNWGNTGYNGYLLWLFYDLSGFVVKYSGVVKYQPIYHFCPSMENEKDIGGIEFLLQSPNSQLPLDRIDDPDAPSRKYIRNIEEATGLSAEQFYQLFTQGEKSGCFDVPADVFPP